MAGINYREVRRVVTMEQVLKLLKFTPVWKRGTQQRGRCPIHQSSSPTSRSFSVDEARGMFRCFGCGQSGNQLDLWAAATQQTLYDATLDLCQRLGVEIPWIRRW